MVGSHVGAAIAQKDIAEGEELCIHYIDKDQSLVERMLDLKHYGFDCDCSRCAKERLEEAAVAAV